MECNLVHCYRSRLKSRGYTDIHITKIKEDEFSNAYYFVECLYYGSVLCAVVSLFQMATGLSVVPAPEKKTVDYIDY